MSDAFVSFLRTLVPVIVGLALAGLLKLGIEVDEAALATVIDGLVVGAYYALVRILERHVWSGFGWFLGAARQPTYTERDVDLAA